MRWLLFLLPFLMAFTPSVPMNLSVTCPTATQCNLTWVDPTPLENVAYIVERATDLNFQNGFVQNTTAVNATTFSSTGLSTGTAYFWRVKASDYVGPVTATPTTSTTSTTGATTTVTTSSTTSSTTATTSSTTNTTTVTTSTTSTTAAGPVLWQTQIGGGSSTQTAAVYGVAQDLSGNTLIAGQFTSTVTVGGPSITSTGYNDGFAAKFTSTGTGVWARGFGVNSDDDVAQGVVALSGGDAVVVGHLGAFGGTANFGCGSFTANTAGEVFVTRLVGATGACVWGNHFPSAAATAVVRDASDNIYVTGAFSGTINFGTGPLTSAGSQDVFVVKFDSTGVAQWAVREGGTDNDVALGLVLDTSNNVFVTGYFASTANFGGGNVTSAGATDGFLFSLTSAGAFRWQQRYGGTGADYFYGLAVDASNNLVVGVYLSSPVDYGTGVQTPNGPADCGILKVANAGTTTAVAHWGGNVGGICIPQGIAVDPTNGDYLLAGYLNGNVNFGGGPYFANGSYDVFLTRFSSTFAFKKQRPSTGSTYNDHGRAVTMSGPNPVFVGDFAKGLDFGGGAMTVPVAGTPSGFVVKLAP